MNWGESFKVGKYEYRKMSGSIWLKVFFHDMSKRVGFKDADEVKLCNSEYKYSILSELSNKMKQANGKFEFLLEYPDLKIMNWWEQSNNPLDEEEKGQTYVSGYRSIYIGAPNDNWGGLAKTTGSDAVCSLINGTPSMYPGSWMFAIGMYQGMTWNGYSNLPSNSAATDVVYIWVRMPTKALKTTVRCSNRDFYLHFVFLVVCS